MNHDNATQVEIYTQEDDPAYLRLLQRHLQRGGVESPLVRFDNLAHLTERLRRPGASGLPPLVLLVDLDAAASAPEETLEALESVLRLPWCAQLPLIVLSLRKDTALTQRCYALGAQAFINKSGHAERLGQLLEVIRSCIHLALHPERSAQDPIALLDSW